MPATSGSLFTTITSLLMSRGDATIGKDVVAMMGTYSQCNKILKSVIRTVPIYVVYFVIRWEWAVCLFPYKQMFSYIAIPISLWMVGAKYQSITGAVNRHSAFPPMMLGAFRNWIVTIYIKLAILATAISNRTRWFPFGDMNTTATTTINSFFRYSYFHNLNYSINGGQIQ